MQRYVVRDDVPELAEKGAEARRRWLFLTGPFEPCKPPPVMRQRLTVLGVVLALALGAGAARAANGHVSVAREASCSGSYVTAHLSWGVKCLRAGEFCKIGNSQYRRYGFVCPPTGHLRRI